jgi:hypothetical protein
MAVTGVKCRGDFLALDGWEIEWQQAIFEHGACGSVRFGGNWQSTPAALKTVAK